MSKWFDSAFESAERAKEARESERMAAEKRTEIFDSQIEDLQAALIASLRETAQSFSSDPRNREPFAITPCCHRISVRKASHPDRCVEVEVQRHKARVVWTYMVRPHVMLEYDIVEHGEFGFTVEDDEVRITGAAGLDGVGRSVFQRFFIDVAHDYAP